MLLAEAGSDVVEIGHGADVDPGLRDCDHHIGVAKAELVDQKHALVGVGDGLAHQVLAGDAEMNCAARKLRSDFACGKIGDLDIVVAHHRAAILAGATRFGERKPGMGEKPFGVFLQAPLRGDRKNERRAHGLLPPLAAGARAIWVTVSTHTEKPTAGIGVAAPSCVIKPS